MRTVVALAAAALVAGLVALPTALAHEHAQVGEYDLTIGWIKEPPVVDQMNGVWLRVRGPAPEFGSGTIPVNGTYSWKFVETGHFAYHCHPHPEMTGHITVVADTDHKTTTHHVRILDGADASTYRYEPAELTIEAGDTVHWMNEGSLEHTVTPTDGHAHADEDAHGDHAEEKHAGHASGGHGHEDLVPVEGVEKTLKVEVAIGGKSRTFDFRALHGQPGVYVAEFIPTVPGTYTAHFTGTIGDVTVDHKSELQRVEALKDFQFPEQTPSAYETKKTLEAQASKIDTLQASVKTASETPANVTPQNKTPGIGLLAVALAGVGAALLLRRR